MKKTIFITILLLLPWMIPHKVEAAMYSCPLAYTPEPETNPGQITFRFDLPVSKHEIWEEIRKVGKGKFKYWIPSPCKYDLTGEISTEADMDQLAYINDGYVAYIVNKPWNPIHGCYGAFSPGDHSIKLIYEAGSVIELCEGPYKISDQALSCDVKTKVNGSYSQHGLATDNWEVEVHNSTPGGRFMYIYIDGTKIGYMNFVSAPGVKLGPWPITDADYKKYGTHTIEVKEDSTNELACSSQYNVIALGDATPTPVPTSPPRPPKCDRLPNPCTDPDCVPYFPRCQPTPTGGLGAPTIDARDICRQIEDRCPSLAPIPAARCTEDAEMCNKCFKQGGAWTALGCIKTDVGGFVRDLFRIILGVVGGIAFLLLLKGGFQVMFSHGDAEEIAEGQQTITAAVFGLIFIFLAVFILRIIGVDILGLPGFGAP